MTEFHILKPSDHSYQVFGGIFGSIESNPNNESVVKFEIDPELKRCSTHFQSLPQNGMEISRDEVVTLNVPDSMVDALKVLLARSLQNKWNKLYAQRYEHLILRARSYDDQVETRQETTLAAVPGVMPVSQTVLLQALKAEQEVANQAVEALVANYPDVKPFFVNIRLEDVEFYTNGTDHLELGISHFSTDVKPSDHCNPVPIAQWGDFQHPALEETNNARTAMVLRNTSGDIDVAIPIYLPELTGVDFLGENNESELREKQAKLMIDVITETPIVKDIVTNNASCMVPNYDSAIVIERKYNEVDSYGDDESDEDDDEYGSDDEGSNSGLETAYQEHRPREGAGM